MKDLILVDTSWVIHRMWHVHQDLCVHLKDGTELKSGHLYGMTRLLKSLTSKYPDARIVLCLDGVAKHGKSLSADYKANRGAGSVRTAFDDLGVIVECALAFPNTTVAYNRSLEADEIISYFVHQNKDNYERVIIYSADGDMLQLLAIGNNIFIAKEFDSSGKLILVDKNVYYSNQKYLDKFCGVAVEALPRYRAMIGDSSDNLAGFPRLRKKVAKEIAEKYQTIRDLMDGCLSGDSLFPAGFKDFLGSLEINYLIMKLPTPAELGDRGCLPKEYTITDNPSAAQILFSLYRIRTTSPVETFDLNVNDESEAMKVRDEINSNWRHPNSEKRD